MTSNPFSSNELLKSLSNYPLTKGDTPGHPFHGNQYSDGGVGAAKELHSETENLRVGMDNGTDYPSADNHREFATAHDRLAASAPTPELREGHTVAANYHRQAADDNDIAERRSGRGSTGEVAADASYDALRASNDVLTDHINLNTPPTPPIPFDPNETF